MTTLFVYKGYDLDHHQHKGKFPDVQWNSETVPVYGCPGVTARLLIFPNGEGIDNRGYVGVFVELFCDDATTYLEAHIGFKVRGKKKEEDGYNTTFGARGEIKFGNSAGIESICGIENVYQAAVVTLEFTIEVKKFQQVKGNQITEIKPAGQSKHTFTAPHLLGNPPTTPATPPSTKSTPTKGAEVVSPSVKKEDTPKQSAKRKRDH